MDAGFSKQEDFIFECGECKILLDINTMRLFKLEDEIVPRVIMAFNDALAEAQRVDINLLNIKEFCLNFIITSLKTKFGECDPLEIQEVYQQLLKSNIIRFMPIFNPDPAYMDHQVPRTMALVAPISIGIISKVLNILINKGSGNTKRSLIFWGAGHFDDINKFKEIVQLARERAKDFECSLNIIVDLRLEELDEDLLPILQSPDMFIRVIMDVQDLASINFDGSHIKDLINTKGDQIEAKIVSSEQDEIRDNQIRTIRARGFRIIESDLTIDFDIDSSPQFISQNYPLVTNLSDLASACHLHLFRCHGCTAGFSYFAVSGDGTLYPCPRFLNMKEMAISNIENGIDPEKSLLYFRNSVDARTSCSSCWARYFCGGGCVFRAAQSGDLTTPPVSECNKFKDQLLSCLAWYVEAAPEDKVLLDILLPISTSFHPYRISSLAYANGYPFRK